MLKLGPQEHSLLKRAEGRPYPEFVLQRKEASGWKVYPADEFTRGEGQVVISILQPGTYRVVAALSPYLLYESPAVQVGDDDKQVMTTLQPGSQLHLTKQGLHPRRQNESGPLKTSFMENSVEPSRSG